MRESAAPATLITAGLLIPILSATERAGIPMSKQAGMPMSKAMPDTVMSMNTISPEPALVARVGSAINDMTIGQSAGARIAGTNPVKKHARTRSSSLVGVTISSGF